MGLPKGIDRVLIFALAVMALGGCAANRGTIGGDQEALRLQIQTLETRLRTLETRAGQVSVAVKSARAAVAFVWGAYTFVDPTGRPLRHVLNEAGQPIADAQGVPLVDVTGTGAIAITSYSGTAFLVGTAGELLTNRHIAEHWWENEESAPLLDAGFRPVLLRLRAFFQERETGVPIEVLRVDPEQDIALARTIGWTPSAAPLPLHPDPGTVEDGQPVMLMGFPTGLDAIMAKLETAERIAIESVTGAYSYETVERLAELHHLRPTVTGGFLWENLPHVVVYDARTKGGGSGGPLLDREGHVIGVNAAYLSEFQGGNYGVPIQFGRRLLGGGGMVANGPTRETPEILTPPAAPSEAPIAPGTAERAASQKRR
jgi:S1-C subfamily serine protease